MLRVNLGDVDLFVEVRLAASPTPQVLWRFGPPRPRPRPLPPAPPAGAPTDPDLRGVQFVAALQADKRAEFALMGKDEMENPVPLTGGTAVFAVDRLDILTLVDNGDGTGSVAATGLLGTAVLSADGTTEAGLVFRGSAAVDVVPGEVATVDIVFGPPTEVTPDV